MITFRRTLNKLDNETSVTTRTWDKHQRSCETEVVGLPNFEPIALPVLKTASPPPRGYKANGAEF